MKITKNLLHNQQYVLGKNEIEQQQEKYICNKYMDLYFQDFFIETIIYYSAFGVVTFILILISGVKDFIVGLALFIMGVVFLSAFSKTWFKQYKKLSTEIKKLIFSDIFIKIYFKKEASRVLIIKNNIQYNYFLYD